MIPCVASMAPTTGWMIVLSLGALWIALGIYLGRKAKTAEGYMLAGRNVGLAFGAATAMATWVTSNTMMVAPLLAFEKGIWGMLAYSSACFGLLLFAPMAGRIRKILPQGTTSGDFFRNRYGTAGWVVFLLITLVYSVTWLVTMAIAGGRLLEALGGIPYEQGMSLILFVCVAYTLFGGLYAVIGTDFVQSLIILIGVVFLGFMALRQIPFEQAYDHLATHQPGLLDVLMPAALLALFNNMIFGFGEVFHNNVWWSRAFAIRKGLAFRAYLLAGLLWLPIPIAAGLLGLLAGPLGVNVTDPSAVGPLVAQHVLDGAGFGAAAGVIILIVLFCSIASSVDSLLAATSDLLVKDVYVGWFGRTLDDRGFRKVAAVAILGVAAVAWGLALSGWNIATVLYSAGPLVASLIWPVIAGLYWKGCNRAIVVAGMIAGTGFGLMVEFGVGSYLGALVGGAVSMAFTFLARYVSPTPFTPSPVNKETELLQQLDQL